MMGSARVLRGARRWGVMAALLVSATVMQGCSREAPAPAPIRTVKAFVVGDSLESSQSPRAGVRYEKDPALPAFDVAGRVMTVLVRAGDTVVEGQALARLDPADMALSESSARVQLAAAEAERDAAESAFQRYAELRQKGFISQAEFERRESEVKAVRAKFEATSDTLGFMTLRALSAGRVESVIAVPGMAVVPRQAMMVIQVVGSSAASARSAMSPRATPGGPMVPLASVVGGQKVYRLRPAQEGLFVIEPVDVTTGRVTELGVEILSGVARGDRIVAAGAHVLSAGETVRLLAP
jgi:multidrug efflux pump subunit AcrA (membrane-fusion protein)